MLKSIALGLSLLLSPTAFAAGYSMTGVPNGLLNTASQVVNQGSTLKDISFNSTGGWVLMYDFNRYLFADVAVDAQLKLSELANQGYKFKAMAFGPGNTWVLLYDEGAATWSAGIPQTLIDQLNLLHGQGVGFRDVALAANGSSWMLVTTEGRIYWNNVTLSQGDMQTLQGREILSCAFGGGGSALKYVITYTGGFLSRSGYATFDNKLQEILNEGNSLIDVSFSPNGSGFSMLWL